MLLGLPFWSFLSFWFEGGLRDGTRVILLVGLTFYLQGLWCGTRALVLLALVLSTSSAKISLRRFSTTKAESWCTLCVWVRLLGLLGRYSGAKTSKATRADLGWCWPTTLLLWTFVRRFSTFRPLLLLILLSWRY